MERAEWEGGKGLKKEGCRSSDKLSTENQNHPWVGGGVFLRGITGKGNVLLGIRSLSGAVKKSASLRLRREYSGKKKRGRQETMTNHCV